MDVKGLWLRSRIIENAFMPDEWLEATIEGIMEDGGDGSNGKAELLYIAAVALAARRRCADARDFEDCLVNTLLLLDLDDPEVRSLVYTILVEIASRRRRGTENNS